MSQLLQKTSGVLQLNYKFAAGLAYTATKQTLDGQHRSMATATGGKGCVHNDKKIRQLTRVDCKDNTAKFKFRLAHI